MKLQEEMYARRQEGKERYVQEQQYYGSVLESQLNENQQKQQQFTNEEREAYNRAKGLQFECYTRDQIIAQERAQTKDFQKQ